MSALYCFEEKEKQGRYSLVSNVDIRVLRVTDNITPSLETFSLELSDLLSSILFWQKNFRMKQKKIDKDQRILALTAIAIWLQVVGILKLINIDGGFDVLTLDTIFNFPPTCVPWKWRRRNWRPHGGARDVTRAASYTLVICWSYRVVRPMGGYAPGVF